jgi:PleD family two-component response regulator
LVEPSFQDACFLQEALEEVQETAQRGSWVPFQVTHEESLEEVRAMAAARIPDVVLLNPDLPGATPLSALAQVQAACPGAPVILLVRRGEDRFARRLLREGAQDYLIRVELDCAPLARALFSSVERQRYLRVIRSACTLDDLTGFHNHRAFHSAAARELRLAAGAGQTVVLLLADIDNLTGFSAANGRQQHTSAVLDAADLFREACGPLALLARLADRRFAALAWNQRPHHLACRAQTLLAAQPRTFALRFGWAVAQPGEVQSLHPLLWSAEACLCENGQSLHHIAIDRSPSTRLTQSATACRA